VFEQLMAESLVSDGTISQSGAQAAELWHWREAISESIAPMHALQERFVCAGGAGAGISRDLEALVAEHYPDFEVVWFGHIGDGNLHMNVLKPESWSTADFHAGRSQTQPARIRTGQRYQGSVSAEHGVGLLKRACHGRGRL
jgi:FAD/FMN-containing dehydrogenase